MTKFNSGTFVIFRNITERETSHNTGLKKQNVNMEKPI